MSEEPQEKEKLEKILDSKVKPIVEEAMQKHLGITINEIETDISDQLKKSPLLDIDIDTSIPFKEAKKNFKRKYITRLLQLNLGNISEVSRKAGIDRRSIHRLIRELDIDPEAYREILIRGTYIKQAEVKNIIESSLETYRNVLAPEKFESLYSHAPDISRNILRELPESILPLAESIKKFEKKYLSKALEENNHNISETARVIGLRFETLHRKLKSLKII